MPYKIIKNHPDCAYFAVVKESDGELMGCHKTNDKAKKQITALNISEYDENAKKYKTKTKKIKYNRDEGAQTPAPKKDQITGSDKNKPGSAGSGSGASIKFSEKTLKSIEGRIEKHNQEVADKGLASWRKLKMGQAKKVVRRGFGAFSSSHRPGMSRVQWGLARLKAFSYLLLNDKPQNSKYTTDNDILPSQHPKSSKEKKEEEILELELRQAPSTVPPAWMIANFKKGLKYYDMGLGGQGLVRSTLADARRGAAGEALGETKIRKMAGWFPRHKVDLTAPKNNINSSEYGPKQDPPKKAPGITAWLLWGGDESGSDRAEEWAERKRDQYNKHEEEMKRNAQENMAINAKLKKEKEAREHFVSTATIEKEVRHFNVQEIECRDNEDGSLTLKGYASVFEVQYPVNDQRGSYLESINPGAFKKTLSERADVKLLVNHDGVPLARTQSGTMELREDQHGLFVEATLDPENPKVKEINSAMKRGDMDEMSFAFAAVRDEFNDDYSERNIKEVKLYDVSVVTYPASSATHANIRSTFGRLNELLDSETDPENKLQEIRNMVKDLDQLDDQKEISKNSMSIDQAKRKLDLLDL